MKMISSTSTTSTSGVMLISDCKLEPEASLLSCMMSLSPRAGAFCDQPYPAEPGLFNCDHGLPDLAEVEPRVAPDHDPGVRLVARRLMEGLAALRVCDLLIVDPSPAGVVHRNQYLASVVALIA